jgi:4-hydroxybenzoate polyprenyltransferase
LNTQRELNSQRSWLDTLAIWGEMVKFSHSIFALPFAVIAAFLAARHLPGNGLPHAGQMGLIVICMVAARSVAMTFNRIVDAQIDARNPRTASRPIPSGQLTLRAAWIMLGIAGITFGFGCLGFYMFYQNHWPILLSGPVLLVLCGYSLTKRFTRWSHFYLGLAIAFSPVAAWIAIHPASVGASAVVLMAAVACWIGGFDIIYSCQDIDIDRQQGLHSLPSRMGPARALWIARGAHFLTIIGLCVLGSLENLGIVYWSGVVVTATLLIIENTLVRPGDYSRVTLAFFTINGVISVLLAAAVVTDVLLS